MAEHGDITELLKRQVAKEPGAHDQLIDLVFEELCTLAHRQMRRERSGHTLDTRSLVNEAYLRIAELNDFAWNNRGHFFGIAGLAMKRILIQHARGKMAKKRGEGARAVPLEDVEILTDDQAENLILVDEALGDLEKLSPRYRKVVELKVFCGLTLSEIGEALEVSQATAKRDWVFARAWLNQALAVTRAEESLH